MAGHLGSFLKPGRLSYTVMSANEHNPYRRLIGQCLKHKSLWMCAHLPTRNYNTSEKGKTIYTSNNSKLPKQRMNMREYHTIIKMNESKFLKILGNYLQYTVKF